MYVGMCVWEGYERGDGTTKMLAVLRSESMGLSWRTGRKLAPKILVAARR
jgi:hypothetical protein